MLTRLFSSITQYFRPRIPRLYYGTSRASLQQTDRQRLAGVLYIAFQVLSWLLVLIGALLGYIFYHFYGLLLGSLLGYTLGIWVRRSLGMRGRKATTGFFARLRERALGSRPGILEGLLENISREQLTQAKCRAMIQAQEKAVERLKQASSHEEQNKILAELDRRLRQMIAGGSSR